MGTFTFSRTMQNTLDTIGVSGVDGKGCVDRSIAKKQLYGVKEEKGDEQSFQDFYDVGEVDGRWFRQMVFLVAVGLIYLVIAIWTGFKAGGTGGRRIELRSSRTDSNGFPAPDASVRYFNEWMFTNMSAIIFIMYAFVPFALGGYRYLAMSSYSRLEAIPAASFAAHFFVQGQFVLHLVGYDFAFSFYFIGVSLAVAVLAGYLLAGYAGPFEGITTTGRWGIAIATIATVVHFSFVVWGLTERFSDLQGWEFFIVLMFILEIFSFWALWFTWLAPIAYFKGEVTPRDRLDMFVIFSLLILAAFSVAIHFTYILREFNIIN